MVSRQSGDVPYRAGMSAVSDYKDLSVYRKAFTLQQRVFEASKEFPRSETFSLTDQVRRSSRSIGDNLAEAWKKRRHRAHFVSKLTDADAAETAHWLRTAEACGYLTGDARRELEHLTREVGRMLGAMIRDANRWCVSPRRTDG